MLRVRVLAHSEANDEFFVSDVVLAELALNYGAGSAARQVV